MAIKPFYSQAATFSISVTDTASTTAELQTSNADTTRLINGAQGGLSDFSGTFGSSDLRFFYGNSSHIDWIKTDSLKIYNRPRW